MGSPLGLTFANIILCIREILWLEKCAPEFRQGGKLMTLFCFFKMPIKLKNSNITLTSNMLILSLPLELGWKFFLFLTSELNKTINSLPQFIASLHLVERLQTLRVSNSYKYAIPLKIFAWSFLVIPALFLQFTVNICHHVNDSPSSPSF